MPRVSWVKLNRLAKQRRLERMEKEAAVQRFLKHVKKTKKCWLWLVENKKNKKYGVFWFNRKLTPAHRFSYEIYVAKIPKGFNIDHICRNHSCVNPDHLRILSVGDNIRIGKGYAAMNFRKSKCIKGHLLDEKNTAYYHRRRRCKICQRQCSTNFRNMNKLTDKEVGA